MRTIRIDDYPNGNPGYDKAACRAVVAKACGIFEAHGVPYMLGVSPLLMDGEDIQFLNETMKTGSVVMHGFSHFMEFQPWDRIVETWPKGGEFMDMSHEDIEKAYNWSHKLLSLVHRYDPTHFIAPFNCHTQAALDVLSTKGIKYWHGCSKEWDAYGYDGMDYHGMTPVISPYQTLYDYAHKVFDYLCGHPDDMGQITLHWIFDRDHAGWGNAYENLCLLIKGRDA